MSRRLTRQILVATFVILALWIVHVATVPALPKPSDPPRLYSKQARDDLRLTLAGAIDRAERSVDLAIYALTEETVLAALQRAIDRGLDVTILYHKKRRGPQLEGDVKLIPYKPSGLMHQKILVIDGKEVWIGSANMTYESLRVHDNLVVALHQPALAGLLIESIASRADGATPLSEHVFDSNGQRIEFWQTATDEGALDRLIDLIDEAQESLFVGMFTWTHPRLTEAAIHAHERGVDVRIWLDATSAAGSSEPALEQLEAAGVAVGAPLRPGLLHHKTAWIDGTTLVVGSANWTRSAFSRNDDCYLVLQNLSSIQGKKLQTLFAAWPQSALR